MKFGLPTDVDLRKIVVLCYVGNDGNHALLILQPVTEVVKRKMAEESISECLLFTMAALFYSPVDFTDASDMHHSNASLTHR